MTLSVPVEMCSGVSLPLTCVHPKLCSIVPCPLLSVLALQAERNPVGEGVSCRRRWPSNTYLSLRTAVGVVKSSPCPGTTTRATSLSCRRCTGLLCRTVWPRAGLEDSLKLYLPLPSTCVSRNVPPRELKIPLWQVVDFCSLQYSLCVSLCLQEKGATGNKNQAELATSLVKKDEGAPSRPSPPVGTYLGRPVLSGPGLSCGQEEIYFRFPFPFPKSLLTI
nr:uncharacterized protein LOC129449206 [Misgurnus anguillicaudatus]